MSTVRNFFCRSAYLRIAFRSGKVLCIEFRSGKVLRIGVSFWATIGNPLLISLPKSLPNLEVGAADYLNSFETL